MGLGEYWDKFILIAGNVLSAILGLILLGLGLALQLKISIIVKYMDVNYHVPPICSMVVGCIILIVALLGCYGAIRESKHMLITYSILLLILIVVKLIVVVIIFVEIKDMLPNVVRLLDKVFKMGPKFFSAIETTFICCGTVGVTSYDSEHIPSHCCQPYETCTYTIAYRGCNDAVYEYIDKFGNIIGFFAIVAIVIELVALIFALCVTNHVRNKERRNVL